MKNTIEVEENDVLTPAHPRSNERRKRISKVTINKRLRPDDNEVKDVRNIGEIL